MCFYVVFYIWVLGFFVCFLCFFFTNIDHHHEFSLTFFLHTYTHRCDEKKRKKLLTYLETSSADGYEAAVELEEHISQLSEQLELKGEEVKKLETNMEEVTGAKHMVKQLFMYLYPYAFTFCSSYSTFYPWCFSLCYSFAKLHHAFL